MPLYDYSCDKCGSEVEVLRQMDGPSPLCCGEVMTRRYAIEHLRIDMGYPMWVNRIDEIHKAQADRGEKLRLPHPREVRAT